MRVGLHIVKNPAGTYSYVGNVPAVLCSIVPASKADVMGGRAFRDEHGAIVTNKAPVFSSWIAAWDTAVSFGFEPIDNRSK